MQVGTSVYYFYNLKKEGKEEKVEEKTITMPTLQTQGTNKTNRSSHPQMCLPPEADLSTPSFVLTVGWSSFRNTY